MLQTLSFIFLVSVQVTLAQKTDYFYTIPEAPSTYSPAHVLARMVDGLGFRYYWASRGLQMDDLSYSPNKEARTTLQTLQHIDGLTNVVRNTIAGKPTTPSDNTTLTFDQLRSKTLSQLQEASEYLHSHDLNPEKQRMVFRNDHGSMEYPLWNLINGPLSDALWHVGQVVSFRRSSGNPLPAGVDVLRGTKTDY